MRYHKSYDGFSLVRITPKTQQQLDYVLRLNANSTIGLDFWLRTTAVNRSADVMVPPESTEVLLDMPARSIHFEYLITDIGKILRWEKNNRTERKGNFFEQYRSFNEINDFLAQVVRERKHIATLLEIGRSTENNPIYLIKLSTSNHSKKPAIWIQGGAHSREQIGTAVVLYLLHQLVDEFSRSREVKHIVDAFDWYLLPVANPDGYDYAFYWDRLWRKTRSINPPSPHCLGVDFNRNWDFHWNDATGSSNDPCSQNFAGTGPFSEPETRAISSYIFSLRERLLLFLDMHSYSQRWLTPWGYTTELPPNYAEQVKLAEITTRALESIHGIKYTVGSSAGTLYTVSGGARDWAYGVAGAKFSYTVELRDDGKFGFLLPAGEIIPSGEETWVGVKTMVAFLSREHAREHSYDSAK